MDMKHCLSTVAALIKYLNLMQEANHGQYKLARFDLSQYIKLDAAAVLALNLNPGPHDGKAS